MEQRTTLYSQTALTILMQKFFSTKKAAYTFQNSVTTRKTRTRVLRKRPLARGVDKNSEINKILLFY